MEIINIIDEQNIFNVVFNFNASYITRLQFLKYVMQGLIEIQHIFIYFPI